MATPSAARTGGRRRQILAVAARLFARHGFHGVRIADLGAAVGVSGPALYRHFSGKDALLEEMLVGVSERLLAGGETRAAASDDPREVLAASNWPRRTTRPSTGCAVATRSTRLCTADHGEMVAPGDQQATLSP